MSDVMHGPKVSDGRKRRKIFLIAFIDDATRVIPFAAFAFSKNTTTFLPVFKQAIARRGLPARLFVDNGANYRSQQLALVCAKLSIALIHARPYQPAGKGKIERWFRTLRAAWLSRLDDEATASLEALNRSLWSWVEGEYHQSPHRGLDARTPLDQWALAAHSVRYPDPATDLDDLFLFEAKRRVMKDRTLSLHGRLYEVDAVLVGHTVTLRYDPEAPPSRPIEVVHDGHSAGLATRLKVRGGSRRDRAWRLGDAIYLRTAKTLVGPQPLASERGAHGDTVYRLSDTPYGAGVSPWMARGCRTHRPFRRPRAPPTIRMGSFSPHRRVPMAAKIMTGA